jgi:hypothetical protein
MQISGTAYTIASIYYPIVTQPLERAMANPILQARIAKLLAKLLEKVKPLMDAAKRLPWKGFPNIFKATADEVAAAVARIKNFRATTSASGGNDGYLEGVVNGKAVDSKMWRSGQV